MASQLITFTLLLLFIMGRGDKCHMCVASTEEGLNEKGGWVFGNI